MTDFITAGHQLIRDNKVPYICAVEQGNKVADYIFKSVTLIPHQMESSNGLIFLTGKMNSHPMGSLANVSASHWVSLYELYLSSDYQVISSFSDRFS